MCRLFSCVVVPDGRVLVSSDLWEHSHSKIRAEHGIRDTVSVNQAANVEVVPPNGAFLSDVGSWQLILDHEREPGWWSDDKVALADHCREAVSRWQKKLQGLTALALGCTELSNAGAKEIGKLDKLTALALGCTELSDAGAKEIGKLDKLTALDLGWTELSDAGAKEIGKLDKLTALDLGCTKLSDAGAKEIGKLDKLTAIALGCTKLSNSRGQKEIGKARQADRDRFLGCTKLSNSAGAKEIGKARQARPRLDLGCTELVVRTAGAKGDRQGSTS